MRRVPRGKIVRAMVEITARHPVTTGKVAKITLYVPVEKSRLVNEAQGHAFIDGL